MSGGGATSLQKPGLMSGGYALACQHSLQRRQPCPSAVLLELKPAQSTSLLSNQGKQ